MKKPFDALVVGAGPNGLSAALVLARAGLRVVVVEAGSKPGGGCRTDEVTLPGYLHDICATAHPLGAASPFFRSLEAEGVEFQWSHPEVVLAHPHPDSTETALFRSLEKTVGLMGKDGEAWRGLVAEISENLDKILADILKPPALPSHPLLAARFAMKALRSASGLSEATFSTEGLKVLFNGIAAHAKQDLDSPPSSSFGLVLGAAAHAVGWPFAYGGSASIIQVLAKKLIESGGEIISDAEIASEADLRRLAPGAKLIFFSVTPRQLLEIIGPALPKSYAARLAAYRYGTGVFKIDYALKEPIPWKTPYCRQAGTVHLGASVAEIKESLKATAAGRISERPYVIVAQATLADPSRAPTGRYTAWVYAHAPAYSDFDQQPRIEEQIERYAPGFGDVVLASRSLNARQMEAYNANYVGGDIGAGEQNLMQTVFRPFPTLNPYRLPVKGWYSCSASTPPGGGVHGMSGYNAAQTALKDLGWLKNG